MISQMPRIQVGDRQTEAEEGQGRFERDHLVRAARDQSHQDQHDAGASPDAGVERLAEQPDAVEKRPDAPEDREADRCVQRPDHGRDAEGDADQSADDQGLPGQAQPVLKHSRTSLARSMRSA